MRFAAAYRKPPRGSEPPPEPAAKKPQLPKRPALDRKLRNEEIPYRQVRLVDKTTGQLGPLVYLKDLLHDIKNDRTRDANGQERRASYFVELVTEVPEVVVKLVDPRDEYQKQKDRAEQAKKAKKGEGKEVQMSWSISDGDLAHKVKKVQQFIGQGHRVNVVFALKKGHTYIAPSEMHGTIQKLLKLLENDAEEAQPALIRGALAVISLKAKGST